METRGLRGKATSLTLACCEDPRDYVTLREMDGGLVIVGVNEADDQDGQESSISLDAASEASLLAFLRAREEERHG